MVRNIPFFTTEFGVASLTLSEIPYKRVAYIRIQEAIDPIKLVEEAANFCRAAGAERVYVTGQKILEFFPYYTEVWKMTCLRSDLPQTNAKPVALEESSLTLWRNIYNERMAQIPLASTMSMSDAKEILLEGTGYFIYQDDVLIGIGCASPSWIKAIISVVPGKGADVVLALNQVLDGLHVSLEVASENKKAIALYNRLGFTKEETVSVWYEFIFSVTEKYLTP